MLNGQDRVQRALAMTQVAPPWRLNAECGGWPKAQANRGARAWQPPGYCDNLQHGQRLRRVLSAGAPVHPTVVERAFIVAPNSRLGPLTPAERKAAIENSVIYGHYEQIIDRESAFEKLRGGATASQPGSPAGAPAAEAQDEGGGLLGGLSNILFGTTGPRGGRHPGLAEQAARSMVRTVGSSIGREIVRGVLGSILGSGSKRR